MIEREHARLSSAAQCRLVSIRRSSFYCAPALETAETLALMAKMGCRRPTGARGRAIRTLSTGFTRTCCAIWRSLDRTRSGADITYLPMRRGFLYLVAIMLASAAVA